MEQHPIEDAVWQRMLAALETVPCMHCRDLNRLRCFISACFVVMRTNLTWAELGGLVPSAETAKKRFRRWAKKGVFDRLMECSQPVAAPDVLRIDGARRFRKRNADVKCHRTAAGARGGGDERIGRSRGGLTAKAHHGVDGLGFIRRQLTSPGQQGGCTRAEALTAGLHPLSVVGDRGYDSDKAREHWRGRGIGVCIPPKRNRIVQHWYDRGLYRTRHLVENSFSRLRDFRRLSLRLDKTDTSLRGFAAFAAAILNWRLKVRLCAQAQARQ